jgi:hypothetical protein
VATALRKLTEQVVDAVVNDKPWRAKAHRLQQGLRRKHERLLTDDVAQRLGQRPWLFDVQTFVNNYLDDPVVEILLLPTADLRFVAAQRAGLTSHETVFASAAGHGVECYRDDTTLLINPGGQVGATESWSRRISITKVAGPNAYPKHLYRQNYKGRAAMYAANVVPRDVEAMAVKGGLGHKDGNDRVFFYARFTSVTGTVHTGAGREDTRYLKVQLDKVKRPVFNRLLKGGQRREHHQGWEVHMHGYPISLGELRLDFRAGATQVEAAPIG